MLQSQSTIYHLLNIGATFCEPNARRLSVPLRFQLRPIKRSGHGQSSTPSPENENKKKTAKTILHLPSRISNFRCAWWATDGQQIAHNFIIINARTAATSQLAAPLAPTCNLQQQWPAIPIPIPRHWRVAKN